MNNDKQERRLTMLSMFCLGMFVALLLVGVVGPAWVLGIIIFGGGIAAMLLASF